MASPRRISTRRKVLFSGLALFGFLVFAEAYARVRTYLDTGNPKYLWTTPHAALRFGLGPLPYRGRELSEEKPPGVFRIAALGGSTTFGWGIEVDSKTWPAQLEAILNRRGGKTRFEVMNLGEPHATSRRVLQNRFPIARRYRADFYLIFSGYNDYDKALREGLTPEKEARRTERKALSRRAPGAFRGEDLLERVTLFILSYSVFAHRLRELIAKVWYKDIDYFYRRERERRATQGAEDGFARRPEPARGAERPSREPPVRLLRGGRRLSIDLPAVVKGYRSNITDLVKQIRSEKAGAALMTLPVQWDHPGARHILESGSLAALNGAIRELAASQEVFLCDVEGVFKRYPDPGRFFIWDYFHPDANGAKLIAETLAGCLERAKALPP